MSDQTVYGTKELRLSKVRQLCESINDNTAPDIELLDFIVAADNRVSVATDKYDWIKTDNKFATILDISNHIAAANYLHTIPNADQQKITNLLTEARAALKTLVGKDPEHQNSKQGITVGMGIDVDSRLDPQNY